MAISIDWGNTNVISVPQADLTFVSGAFYELDTDWFRLQLKALEESVDGMPWPRTHSHNTEVTVAGITFARTIEILSPYSVTFENTGSPYAVQFVGSNNNIWDAENGILNVTPQVSYIPTNSAGLQVVETGVSGLTPSESLDLKTVRQWLTNAQRLAEGTAANFKMWDDGDDPNIDTPLSVQDVTDKDGNPIILPTGAPAHRSEAT